MTSIRRLRFALMGTGDFGPHFAPYINEVAELVAVCDPNPQSRARFSEQTQLQLPEYDHHEPLLAEVDIDGVVIASPNFTHKGIAVAAAERGRHVFCEKAMATSVPDCWEMVRACESAGVRLMVGHKRRLRPPWGRMIELREQLGQVLSITSCAYFDARPYDHQGWWTCRDQRGGTLAVIGVHIVDWMRAMCGDVVTVRAVAAPRVDPRYDFPDTLHVSLQFDSGAIATLNVSMVYPPRKFREAGGPLVICKNGGMRFVPFREHLDLYSQILGRLAFIRPSKRHQSTIRTNTGPLIPIEDMGRWILASCDGRTPRLTAVRGRVNGFGLRPFQHNFRDRPVLEVVALHSCSATAIRGSRPHIGDVLIRRRVPKSRLSRIAHHIRDPHRRCLPVNEISNDVSH